MGPGVLRVRLARVEAPQCRVTGNPHRHAFRSIAPQGAVLRTRRLVGDRYGVPKILPATRSAASLCMGGVTWV